MPVSLKDTKSTELAPCMGHNGSVYINATTTDENSK